MGHIVGHIVRHSVGHIVAHIVGHIVVHIVKHNVGHIVGHITGHMVGPIVRHTAISSSAHKKAFLAWEARRVLQLPELVLNAERILCCVPRAWTNECKLHDVLGAAHME